MQDYLLDVLIVSMSLIMTYTVFLIVLCVVLKFFGEKFFPKIKQLINDNLSKKELMVYYLIGLSLIIIVKATSDPVTWRNTVHDTVTEIQQIQTVNTIKYDTMAPIVDRTKQPDRNSETTKKELERKLNSWKEKEKEID